MIHIKLKSLTLLFGVKFILFWVSQTHDGSGNGEVLWTKNCAPRSTLMFIHAMSDLWNFLHILIILNCWCCCYLLTSRLFHPCRFYPSIGNFAWKMHIHPPEKVLSGEFSHFRNRPTNCRNSICSSQFPSFHSVSTGVAFLINVTRFSFVVKNLPKKCL